MPQAPRITLVDDASAAAGALAGLDGDAVGLDVERADADRYHRRAALVQVGVAGRCVLLDAVRLASLPELDAFLDDGRLAVFHALENDLAPLASHGVTPGPAADTAIAAAVLGLPTGLRPLLALLLGVEPTDDKAALQRADWAARPLTEGMIAYAAGDVVHLPRLWDELARRLEDAGRRAWYDEELEDTARRALVSRRGWTDVKGAGGLDPGQRAVLRALWEAREELARTHDLAPNRLLHDDVLRELALEPPASEGELVRRSPRRRGLLRPHAGPLLEAVRRGLAADPEPRTTARTSDEDRRVHDALRRRRAEVARDLGVEPGLLCPAGPLWRAVTGGPRDGIQLCELTGLNAWRTRVLADPLWEAYVTTRGTEPAAAPGSTGG